MEPRLLWSPGRKPARGTGYEMHNHIGSLDFSAAFSTIDHVVLLDHLARLVTEATVLQWFPSFLPGHAQKVVLGEHCSNQWSLARGIPSHILFNVCMKPLGHAIWSFGVRCHEYADDTQLYSNPPCYPRNRPRPLNAV